MGSHFGCGLCGGRRFHADQYQIGTCERVGRGRKLDLSRSEVKIRAEPIRQSQAVLRELATHPRATDQTTIDAAGGQPASDVTANAASTKNSNPN